MPHLKHPKSSDSAHKSLGFFRYIGIIAYDALLLLALLFLATALLLPFNEGEAFTSNQFFFPIYLLLVSFFYYGWFWTHGGQTLGMKTWKVQIKTFDKQPLSWLLALKRFCGAMLSWGILATGFLWKIIDKKNYTLHDHLSKTALFFEDN